MLKKKELPGNMKFVLSSEDYVQTSPNSLYASSANALSVNGNKLPYTWNNTVSYDTLQGTMP
jgi:hypothetical protein